MKENVAGVILSPHGQFVARFIAVPVPPMLKESVEVVRLVPHVQISEMTCDQMVKLVIPQVAEQFVVCFVAVKCRRQCACLGASMLVWISFRFSDLSETLCERHLSVAGGGYPQTFALREVPGLHRCVEAVDQIRGHTKQLPLLHWNFE